MVYDLIIIDPEKIKLHVINIEGEKGLSFSELIDLKEIGKLKILFATNGGIYQKNRKALGYLSSEAIELNSINRSDGWGNFYLKPNGVFLIDGDKPEILETEEFYMFQKYHREPPWLATQSGPLLLWNNKIHPAFNKGSSNKYIRNGVGIIEKESSPLVVFVISDRPVNFYDFSHFFKDFLHCSDALYLDGHISAMYLPEINRKQMHGSFGPVIYAYTPNK